jgi:hypothetical protein
LPARAAGLRAAVHLPIESFLNLDRDSWGVESGLHQRLDCPALEDRMRARHKGVVPILGLFSRNGVARFIPRAGKRALARERTDPWFARQRAPGNS